MVSSWEWDPPLTRRRRVEAEEEFRRRLLLPSGGDSDNSNDSSGIGRSAAADNNTDMEKATSDLRQQQQQQEEQQLPPHRRPRKRQIDYRGSPLEPDDDEKIVPDLRFEAIATAVPAAIERERLFEDGVLPLMGKRVWKYRGLNYEKAHPMSESGLQVTPDDWAEDDGDSKPWPRGCKYDAGVLDLCWAFFLFVYGKNRQASIKVVVCEVLCSLVPPACSYLFGTGLLDELNSSTSVGQSERDRILYASLFAIGILLLRVFAQWLNVYYSNSIPTGGTRTALRDVLFHRMQGLQNPTLKDKITPGAASGIIVDKVHDAVGVYYQFLTFPSLIAGLLGSIGVCLTSIPFVFIPAFSIPTIIVILLAMVVPFLINSWVQPEFCILTRLEHQWRLRLRSLAGSAIPRDGESYKSLHNSDVGPGSSSEEEDIAMRSLFHETAFLEKMRHWQAWKFSVVVELMIGSLSQIGIAVVTISSAYVVITKRITVGNFTTLVSCVSNISSIGEQIGSFFISLYENHMMLKQITAIMNDEDIDFDGGVDVIAKEIKYVKGIGCQVSGQVKNTGQKVATVGKQVAKTMNYWNDRSHSTAGMATSSAS